MKPRNLPPQQEIRAIGVVGCDDVITVVARKSAYANVAECEETDWAVDLGLGLLNPGLLAKTFPLPTLGLCIHQAKPASADARKSRPRAGETVGLCKRALPRSLSCESSNCSD